MALDEHLSGLIDHLKNSLCNAARGVSLHYKLEPLKLKTDVSINLGVIVTSRSPMHSNMPILRAEARFGFNCRVSFMTEPN